MCGARPPRDDASRSGPRRGFRLVGVYLGIPPITAHAAPMEVRSPLKTNLTQPTDSLLTRPACLEMSTTPFVSSTPPPADPRARTLRDPRSLSRAGIWAAGGSSGWINIFLTGLAHEHR